MRNKFTALCAIGCAMLVLSACASTEAGTEPDSTIESNSSQQEDTHSESNMQDTALENTSEATESTTEIAYTYTDIAKTMYATAKVNVRTGPSTDYEKLGSLAVAQEIAVTGQCVETGWYRFAYEGGTGYVSDAYVSETQPKLPQPMTYYDTGDAKLNEMCDVILDDIVNDSMTKREAAYEVYNWVESNIKYRGSTDTSSWIEGAKTSLSTYKGNCYAFYSVSRALLTRLGFENAQATSINNDHYWNLVKVDGTWWHFDATTGWGTQRFLWTNDQINEYQYSSKNDGHYIDYDWDQQGIPEE